MFYGEFKSIESLDSYLVGLNPSFIMVCGYDNVGKGSLITELGKTRDIFYPDYNLICNSVDKSKRWSYFMYSMDMFNKIYKSIKINKQVIFDRCALCGAVYNNDENIAKKYSEYLNRSIKSIHVLVECSESDYYKLQNVRGNSTTFTYEEYLAHTNRYLEYFDKYDIDYVIYTNKYNKKYASDSMTTCRGCSFNKYGKCTNDNNYGNKVNNNQPRCEYSLQKEVQDIDE